MFDDSVGRRVQAIAGLGADCAVMRRFLEILWVRSRAMRLFCCSEVLWTRRAGARLHRYHRQLHDRELRASRSMADGADQFRRGSANAKTVRGCQSIVRS
jgi:hypothetical protein